MWLVEFSLAHRIPVACFSCHKINKISISCLNYSRKQEILLKNLLQNQQNLKARGIYSCTGIYFFKSATKITTLPLHHKIFICHNKKRYVTQIKLSSHILNIFMIISSFTHEPFHSSEYPPAVPASGSCSLKSEKTTPVLKLFQNLYMLYIFH